MLHINSWKSLNAEDMELIGIIIHYWWECTMVQPLLPTVWQFLIEINIFFYTIQQSYCLIFKQRNWKLMCVQQPAMVVYSNFIHNFKTWDQPRNPSISERINLYIQTIGILFRTKRKLTIKPWKGNEET